MTYPHDYQHVNAIINGDGPSLRPISEIRTAMLDDTCVEIVDDRLILSPHFVPEMGHVVYFNVRTPTEWWGRCSGSNKRVVWKRKADIYILYNENDQETTRC